MTIRVVLIGDTHLPRFGRALPPRLVDELRGADRILHIGDITEAFVLDLLDEVAPTTAVAGNNDPPELQQRLGLHRVVEIGELRIAMTHGHVGPGRTTPERAWRAFAKTEPAVAAIAFGHSHQPLIDRRDGVWLLNPGSPTDKRREPAFSLLLLEVEGTRLRPELVTWR
ncbi:MAG: metallophosphoesterase [Chloroflexi bacterium]|nr:metallophosphoesterase [Chloroflexota bacterium]